MSNVECPMSSVQCPIFQCPMSSVLRLELQSRGILCNPEKRIVYLGMRPDCNQLSVLIVFAIGTERVLCKKGFYVNNMGRN